MTEYQSCQHLNIKILFFTNLLTDLHLRSYHLLCFLQMLSYLLGQLMEAFEAEAARSSIMAVEGRKVV